MASYTLVMLKLSGSLRNQPVLSLRSSTVLATAKEPIINPNNLKILGWRCSAGGAENILLADDIRDMGPAGIIVNDEAALSTPVELVRHKEVLEINYQPIGKLVKSNREKLGKVSDYAYNDSMLIQQLYVEPPILKIFGNHETRIVNRKQIKEITDSYILVSDAEAVELEPAAEPVESELPAPEPA